MFLTRDGGGRYRGDDLGYEVVAQWNVPKVIGVKKLQDKDKVIAKINKYIQTNKQVLIDCIER